ncbi:FxSxx-COOH system tetratricopeptide repeat protein [Streptomyces sp. NPDC048209]|uniref:FxSxx-COOH system tetratricopeptide repeat protein n=1 Tax=Streptomyces sp. NPDC048209 TaxID=3156689 RepID=UPI0034188744
MMGTATAEKPGEIVTFYSYKGGTGRTMALANVAWILASNGKSVLVVDWDLEAPGLHRYFHPFLLDKELQSTSGVLDLLWDFAFAALDREGDDGPGWHEAFADPLEHAVSLRWQFPDNGHIDLLCAGKQNRSFGQRVNSFDWHSFYNRLGGGAFIESLREQMARAYDYVLIDSRTGLSDTSGICTIQLPDTLIACFTMSTQSISGCANVVESVMRRRADRAVRVLPVPMRVESGEADRLEESRDWAQWSFRHAFPPDSTMDVERYWGDVEVPYRSLYAYEELLATVGDRPQQEDTLLAAFERLTTHLTRGEITKAVPMESGQRATLRRRYRQRPHGRIRFDFFLAHVAADKPWADWIAAQLTDAGYRVSPDVAAASGGTWSYMLRNALEGSAKVLVLLSPDFSSGAWAAEEATWRAEAATERPSHVLPVRVSQFDGHTPPELSVLAELGLAGLTEEEARETLLEAVVACHGPAPEAPESSGSRGRPPGPSYPDARPGLWEVPERTPPFVGRDAELLRMLRHFRDDGSPYAITGMAGAGKTTLAVEFAHRARGHYGAALFIRQSDVCHDCDDESALGAALREVGHRMRSLPPGPKVLLVLDGFEGVTLDALLRHHLQCHVIVTRRRDATADFRYSTTLQGFTPAEATELMNRYVPGIPAHAADQIAVRLGFLPLALRIAANQLSVSSSSVSDFLVLLDKRLDQVVLRAGGDSGHSLMARFQRMFDRLARQSPAAAHFLALLALTAPHPIPLRLLRADPEVFGPPLRLTVVDGDHQEKAVRPLLVENLAEEKGAGLRAHPVLAAVIRTNLSAEDHERLSLELTRMLVANDPGDPGDAADWPVYRSLMPLVNSVRWSAETGFRELLLRLCWYQLSTGNPLTAKELADRVTKQFEPLLGSVHEDTLAALHMVALCEWELGNVQQAEAVLRRLTEARERLLGPMHPATMASRNNLAAALAGQGKWLESVELHRQILRARITSLGHDHPDTLVSEGNLASSLYGAGDFDHAHQIESSVWRKRVDRFGEDHPASLASADNLASIREKVGEFADALALRRRSLAGRRKTMGEQHPDTLRCAASLVSALVARGETDEARDLARLINENMHKVFGPDNALARRMKEVAEGDH